MSKGQDLRELEAEIFERRGGADAVELVDGEVAISVAAGDKFTGDAVKDIAD